MQGIKHGRGVWNDMNEPSVHKSLDSDSQIDMPMSNTHMTSNGDILQHKWIHNAYGVHQWKNGDRYEEEWAEDESNCCELLETKTFLVCHSA